MSCTLIQTNFVRRQNRGEKAMLDFLRNLPPDYYIYRELKLTPSFLEQVNGMNQKQPDFVVVAPAIGLISIEVKDWNLVRNVYHWQDQYHVRVERPNGIVEEIGNPVQQAESYRVHGSAV